jgi:hypothetical protein
MLRPEGPTLKACREQAPARRSVGLSVPGDNDDFSSFDFHLESSGRWGLASEAWISRVEFFDQLFRLVDITNYG